MEDRSPDLVSPAGPDAAALERTVGELTALYEVSRRLGSTLDADEVLETLLESALALLHAPCGYLVLGEMPAKLFLRASRGCERPPDRPRFSAAEWVLAHERPLVLNPSNAGSPTDQVTGAGALVAVGVPSASGSVGVLVIADRDPTRRFSTDDVRLLSTIANQAGMAVANAELYAQLQDAYLATVRSLAAAIDAKDPYTRGHSDRVASLALLVADRMRLDHDERMALELSAYLHDIGKIGIREDVLHKPGRLDDTEAAEMRGHPAIGATILEHVEFPWAITPNVRHHHEHWDGSGYPDRLSGESIPFLARIISVADSHEAMVSDRPYRRGRTTSDALDELKRCAGAQFDAAIVDEFCAALLEADVGARAPKAYRSDV
jgi:putative nucleotidyltransferase with HDIG domain